MDFQKVAEAIENSRPEIKNLLFSEEIGQLLQNITQQNDLDEETSLKMIDEVGYIILGLKERSSIKSSLANIGIEKNSIPSIIQEISRAIFSELDKIESAKSTETPKQTPAEEKTGTEEPIVITAETKEDALKELSRRSMKNQNPPALVPELAPSNLPMVEKGEAAHDAPQIEPKALSQEQPKPEIKSEPKVSLPDYRYEGGSDPYREPLV